MTAKLDVKDCETLIELLEFRSASTPDKVAYIYLDEQEIETKITYSQLSQQAKAIAATLQAKIKPHDRALLIYPPGLDFIAAFFGCLYSEVIAVPVMPPVNTMLVEKIQKIIDQTDPRIILTTADIQKKITKLKWLKKFTTLPFTKLIIQKYLKKIIHLMQWNLEQQEFLATNNINQKKSSSWRQLNTDSNEIAFLQFTSGSTNFPKGVMVTHANLLHNIKLVSYMVSATECKVVFNWIPLYHDMGLIGGILSPIYYQYLSVLISPITFIKDPISWLRGVTKYKANICTAPNFAFDYCTRKITDEQIKLLDLSSWNVALNGSEPVHAETMERFYQLFKTVGFKKETFAPAYGLAEATLIVTLTPFQKLYPTLLVDDTELKKNKLKIATSSLKNKVLVSSGKILPGQEVVIVNPETKCRCPSDEIGEIWLHGSSITKGYWQQEKITEDMFHARITDEPNSKEYFRTGDLGIIYEDNLYVTGRQKDVIIIHGANHYPQDIEATITDIDPRLRVGCCAAFTIEKDNAEKLVIVTETFIEDHANEEQFLSLCTKISSAIALHHELPVYSIYFIKSKTLDKTTSGKIRHQYIKSKLIQNNLNAIYSWTHSNEIDQIEFEAPCTDAQAYLCNMLTTLLEGRRVGIQDNFLSLGGDSLLAAQLITRIQHDKNIELDSHFLFENPSIATLAAFIENNESPKTPQSKPKIRHELIPLSDSQKRLWFLSELVPNNPFYNLSVQVKIRGHLNIEILEKSINTIIDRHHILRTQFVVKDDTPYQKILASQPIKIGLHFMSIEVKNQFALMPFDLYNDPLIRCHLIVKNDDAYELLFVIHHIIADGWSIRIFANELSQIYNAYSKKLPLNMLPLQYQFADFCLSQTLENATAIQYWQQHLKNAPTYLNLKTDKPRPATPSYQGDAVNVILNTQLVTALKELAKQHKASFYMILHTLYHILLLRYSNQDDIIIGTAIANRHQPETEKLIGFFVNTLPIRNQINNHVSFVRALKEVRLNTLNALNHNLAFDQIVDLVKADRHFNTMPIFQTMFILQNYKNLNLTFNEFEADFLIQTVNAKLDLVLEITELDHQVVAKFEFATDLFNKTTIEKMANHFIHLAHSTVINPYLPVGEYELLDEAEIALYLNTWNSTQSGIENQTIDQLFSRQITNEQHKIAIFCANQSISYQHLNERANQLAHLLMLEGIKSNDYLPIFLERSIDLIVCMLAILKIGGICVPLDPSYPATRIQFILNDIHANTILTQANFIKHPSLKGFSNILIVDNNAAIDNQSKKLIPQSATDLAYLIYTSGSTGKPKGVKLSHINITNRIQAIQELIPLTSTDVLLHQFSFSFDASILYLWWPLCNGSALVLPKQDELTNLDRLAELTHQYQVTTLSSIPTVLDFFLEKLIKQSDTKIKNIITGGETPHSSLLEKIHQLHPDRAYNLYGPTEATIFATAYNILKYKNAESIPIGQPIQNTTVYILNDYLQPVPLGVIGEVFLGGIGLAKGYLNQAQLTQTRFIKNPYTPSTLLYRTGDLARFTDEGDLVFIGRKDFQLKVHGHRIEPEEIEAVLLSHPSIKDAAVTLAPTYLNGNSLVAFIVAKKPFKSLSDELTLFLQTHLPAHMIPVNFLIAKTLPKLENGKLNRQALLNSDFTAIHPVKIAPSNLTEQGLLDIWQQVLKIENIGVTDNFFRVGGNSLSAFHLITLINHKFNLQMQLEFFFDYQTIESQAKFLVSASKHSVTCIIKLSTNNKTPLFCIHPVGGNIFQYNSLVKGLEDHYTIYGITAPGLSGESEPLDNVTNIAAHYIHQIQIIQPEGPYYVLGWSSGGLIAYEIASQLKAKGQQLKCVALIDTADPNAITHFDTLPASALIQHLLPMINAGLNYSAKSKVSWRIKLTLLCLKLLGSHFQKITPLLAMLGFKNKNLDIRNFTNYLALIRHDLTTREPSLFPLENLITFLVENHLVSQSINRSQISNFYNVFRANFYAAEHYHPAQYADSIIYFKSNIDNTYSNWQSYVKKIETINLPCDHYHALSEPKSLTIIQARLKNS